MPLTSLVVRDAGAADRPALEQIFLTGRRQMGMQGVLTLAQFGEQTRGERVLVAEETPATPLGFVSVFMADHFIHHLYVAPGHRRRGVGLALLRALPGWQRVRYRLKCLSLNTSAQTFYTSCGFLPIASGSSENGDYLLLESRGASYAQDRV
ncbi:MAG: GNAT family N-acetyltransferase [Janthinobacterium lividum]